MVRRVESEVPEYAICPLACRLDGVFGLDFRLDFDVLADALDGVERDRVAVVAVEPAVLLDGGDGVESEIPKEHIRVIPVVDARLDLRSRLGFVVDERSLVGHPGRRRPLAGLPTDA